jgi:hypothetical protein
MVVRGYRNDQAFPWLHGNAFFIAGVARIFHKRSAARPESTMPAVLQPQKASSKYFNMSAGFLML